MAISRYSSGPELRVLSMLPKIKTRRGIEFAPRSIYGSVLFIGSLRNRRDGSLVQCEQPPLSPSALLHSRQQVRRRLFGSRPVVRILHRSARPCRSGPYRPFGAVLSLKTSSLCNGRSENHNL